VGLRPALDCGQLWIVAGFGLWPALDCGHMKCQAVETLIPGFLAPKLRDFFRG
jgi:hypothetical protein